MPESLDILKLRVLLSFLDEDPKTCTVTGLAGVLARGSRRAAASSWRSSARACSTGATRAAPA